MAISLKDLTQDQKYFLLTKVCDFCTDEYYIPKEIIIGIMDCEDITMFHIMESVLKDFLEIDNEYKEILKKAFIDNNLSEHFYDNSWNFLMKFLDPNYEYDEGEEEEEIDTELTTKALGMTFYGDEEYSLFDRLSLAKVYYQFIKYGKIKTDEKLKDMMVR